MIGKVVGIMFLKLAFCLLFLPALIGWLAEMAIEWVLGADDDLCRRLHYARVERARRKLDRLTKGDQT